MKIGCHVSIAGGIFNAPGNAAELGCEVVQVFTRSPQGGPAPKLTKEILDQFAAEKKRAGLTEFVVHTPYFINFASSNPRIKKGSAVIIREELERASMIGASYLMTHLGSSKDCAPEQAKTMVVEGILRALDGYTGSTAFCFENSAGAGSAIGTSFEDLGEMIERIETKDKRLKNKIGICLDTCHAFSAGYDLRNPKAVAATMKAFDNHIGLDRLKLIHANDSKFELGAKKDRHDHIGRGNIGLPGFRAMAKHPTMSQVNWYLETEYDLVKQDIALLKKIR